MDYLFAMLKVGSMFLAAVSVFWLDSVPLKPVDTRQLFAVPVNECPTSLRIESNDEARQKGAPLMLEAKMEDLKQDSKLEYLWTVSRGEIKSGQGTSSITLEVERNGRGLSAGVEIKGLPDECPNKTWLDMSHY